MENFNPRSIASLMVLIVTRLRKRIRRLLKLFPFTVRSVRSIIFHANQWLGFKAARQAPPGRLIHGGRLVPRNFLQPCPARKVVFPAFFLRSIAPHEIRRLRAPSYHVRSHLIKDNVTYLLNRAGGFIRPRLRTVSPLLISSHHLERDCSWVPESLPVRFRCSYRIWREKRTGVLCKN